MKKILAVAVVMAVFGGNISWAQESTMIKEGAKSLNFTFGGLGSFGIGASGINGGIGFSYFLDNATAVRGGLQIRSSSTSTPWSDPTGTNPGTDGSASTFVLGLAGDYLMYMSSMSSRVAPYYGVGVFVTMNSSDTKYSISNAAPVGTATELKNGNGSDGLTFGASGIAGAEFFIYPELSVSAEYRLNLISLTSLSDVVSSSKGGADVTTKRGGTTTILGFSGAGATLHIYF